MPKLCDDLEVPRVGDRAFPASGAAGEGGEFTGLQAVRMCQKELVQR